MNPAVTPAAPQTQPVPPVVAKPERTWEEIEARMEAQAARPLAQKIALIGPWRLKSTGSMQGRDGIAWSGDIYKAGKKVGYASDEGNGGMIDVHFLGADRAARDALAAEFVAAAKLFDPENDFEVDGTFASQLMNLADEVKRLKRICKTKVAMRTPDCKGGEWRTFNVPYSAQVAAKIREKHPTLIEIANEALDAY